MMRPGPRLESLASYSLPHAHLPAESRFNVLTSKRDEMVGDLKDLLKRFETIKGILPKSVAADVEGYIENTLGVFQSAMGAARDVLATTGPTETSLYARREAVESRLQQQLSELDEQRIRVQLALFTAETRVQSAGVLLDKRLEHFDEQMNKRLDEINATKGVLSRAVDTKQQAVLTGAFAGRADEHRCQEYTWLVAFLVSLGGLGWALHFVFNSVPAHVLTPASASLLTSPDIAVYVLRNLLVLLVSSFFVKLTLKRWNLERNLQLLYSHRVAALQQMELFTENLPTEERSRLRIEIGREMFADPVTGYLSDSTSDVQVAPVVPILERVIRRDSRNAD